MAIWQSNHWSARNFLIFFKLNETQVQTLVDPAFMEPLPDQCQPPPSCYKRLHQLPDLLLYWQEVQGGLEKNLSEEI